VQTASGMRKRLHQQDKRLRIFFTVPIRPKHWLERN